MTSAPPPAIRPQQNMDLNLDMLQDKALPQQRGDVVQAQSSRPQSTVYRPHEEHNRPVNSVLHSTTKVPPKRPLPQDATDDNYSRPAAPRNAPSHQNDGHQPKRRRTSEKFDGHSDGIAESQPKMTAPPIRQSSIRQKVREFRMWIYHRLLCTDIHRTYQRSLSFLVGTAMHRSQPAFREQLSSLNTISPSQHIQWIWLRYRKPRYLSPQIPAMVMPSTRPQRDLAKLRKGPRANRPPNQLPSPHLGIRMGIVLSSQKSTPTRRTMTRMLGKTLSRCPGRTPPTFESS